MAIYATRSRRTKEQRPRPALAFEPENSAAAWSGEVAYEALPALPKLSRSAHSQQLHESLRLSFGFRPRHRRAPETRYNDRLRNTFEIYAKHFPAKELRNWLRRSSSLAADRPPGPLQSTPPAPN